MDIPIANITNLTIDVDFSNITNMLSNMSTTLNQINQTISIPQIDPNAFYSAAVQSAATVAGIIIAALITWIITNYDYKRRIKDEIEKCETEITSIKKELEPYKKYIAEIDAAEKEEKVLDFLKDMKGEINLKKIPTIDELYEMSQREELSEDIDFETLKKLFNEEYIKSVREYQNTPQMFRSLDLPKLINPHVLRENITKYRDYSEYIDRKISRIRYLEEIKSNKIVELESTKKIEKVKKAFWYILIISTGLVFIPLGAMMFPHDLMFKGAVAIYLVFFFGWVVMCYAVWKTITE